MRFRTLAKHSSGIVVLAVGAAPVVLEFNEFLDRIARGLVRDEDIVVAGIFTGGKRRRAGDLRLFAMIRSGAVRTEDLPRRVPDGVLASGEAATAFLQAIDAGVD